MAIDFELSEGSRISQQHYHAIAEAQMRPVSRKYDLAEHTLPKEWVDYWWQEGRKGPQDKAAFHNDGFVTICRRRSSAGATRGSTCACRPPRSAAPP